MQNDVNTPSTSTGRRNGAAPPLRLAPPRNGAALHSASAALDPANRVSSASFLAVVANCVVLFPGQALLAGPLLAVDALLFIGASRAVSDDAALGTRVLRRRCDAKV